jgi:hypothetical protein
MRKRIFYAVAVMLGLNIFSVYGQKDLQVAKKQFELGIYEESLKSLGTLEKNEQINSEILVLKGMNQYYLGDYFGAVSSFTKARSLSSTDNSYARVFAQVLINTGQYDMAKAELSNLKVDATVHHLMDYCDFASKNSMYKSKDVQLIVGKRSVFGPFMYKGFVHYNSYTAPVMDFNAEKAIKGQIGFHLVKIDGQKEVNVLNGLANRLNTGNISISENGFIVYTKSQPLCESLHCRIKNSSIFIGKFINGSISDERSLPVNETGVSNVDPYISSDGTRILFASDRKGGFGGFDIYSISLENGQWTSPVNLGPVINTMGDELSPSFNGKDIVFSSNYHKGSGGYDIFQFAEGIVTPMKSVNSPADDYNAKISQGIIYYSSNRTGRDGIYSGKIETSEISPSQRTEIVGFSQSKEAQILNPYEGARLVSQGYTITSTNNKSYFVQLGAFGMQNKGYDRFSKASKFGDVYKVFVGQAVKIRIGWFDSEETARLVMAQVRREGFPDAFVVGEVVSTSQVELIYSSGKTNSTSSVAKSTVVSNPLENASTSYNFDKMYKVRLASYEDPIWFDNSKVKDLGKIEQWSKGTWTIFVLGGFKSQEEAESARIKAVNRGFTNAEVVVDSGGMLESLKKN